MEPRLRMIDERATEYRFMTFCIGSDRFCDAQTVKGRHRGGAFLSSDTMSMPTPQPDVIGSGINLPLRRHAEAVHDERIDVRGLLQLLSRAAGAVARLSSWSKPRTSMRSL